MYRSSQSRLLTKHDKIKRKLIDNHLEWLGTLTDSLRIRYILNKEGDIMSRIVEKADVVNIVWPALKDVPTRTIEGDEDSWRITSLVSATMDDSTQNYVIYAPKNKDLRVGDMLFRVFLDDDATKPIILGVVITEQLSTIGQQSIIQNKYNCAIYTEHLTQELVDIIVDFAKRRMAVSF